MVERNGVLELQYSLCNTNGTKIQLAFICRSADSSVDRCHVTLFLIDIFFEVILRSSGFDKIRKGLHCRRYVCTLERVQSVDPRFELWASDFKNYFTVHRKQRNTLFSFL